MNETEQKLNTYKLLYKIFTVLGTVVFLDTIFKSAGIPFFASLVLYPFLDLFFKQDVVFTILGIYSISWLLFFLPAIVLNRKIKGIEKETGIKSEPQKASKSFKITLAAILIPFGILLLIGIIANMAG